MFGLPETLEQQVRAAAAAGFSLMSPDLFSLRAYRDTHSGVHRLRNVLDANGNLDLVGFMSVCDDIGLQGVVSIEVMNEELRQLDVDDYARLVASSTLEVLARVDAESRLDH